MPRSIAALSLLFALSQAACAGPKHPVALDSDGDGVPDTVDRCPHQKEDGKAPETRDGCEKR